MLKSLWLLVPPSMAPVLILVLSLDAATHFNKANASSRWYTKSTEPSKLCHVSSDVFLSCSEEEMFSFLTSFSYSGLGVFALILLDLPIPFFVLPVQWNVPCTSRVSAVFISSHWLMMESICYPLTQISPSDICSSFSFHCTALKMSTLKRCVFTMKKYGRTYKKNIKTPLLSLNKQANQKPQ